MPTMDQISIKTPNPKCPFFFNLPVKVLGGAAGVYAPDPLPPTPVTHYEYIPLYLFTQGRGRGGGGVGEPVRRLEGR